MNTALENSTVTYIKSNFGIDPKNKFRWKENNKNSSRYICSNKDCYTSITIKDDQVIEIRGKHHDDLSEADIKILQAKQELKTDVISNSNKCFLTSYKEIETKLIQNSVPERKIASSIPSYRSDHRPFKKYVQETKTLDKNHLTFLS